MARRASFRTPPYESGCPRNGKDQALRPGGPELTARAVARGAWRPGESVIDIGCGHGVTLDYLARCGLNPIGIDISASALREARHRNPRLAVLQASGDDLPVADAKAEGILAECSLSLIPDASRTLAEFHRVLRPGGRLVITDVYARDPAALSQASIALPRCLSGILEKDKTIRQLENAGFDLDDWEDHSDVLKTFIARFIFQYGGTEVLWGEKADTDDVSAPLAAITALRPGYALLVASKRSNG